MKGWPSRIVRAVRLGYKRLFVKMLRLFGLRSYRLFGIPSGLTDVQSVEEVVPIERVALPPPKTVEPSLHWKYRTFEGGEVEAQGCFRVKGGVATHLGGNLTRSGKLITTYLVPIDGKQPGEHDLFRFSSKRFAPKITTCERVISLTSGWQDMFYHWMYEVLPRLALVSGIEGKLYIDQGQRFQRESLTLLGIPPERIIDAAKWQGVECKELVVPSIPPIPTKRTCAFLRENIQIKKKRARRLYLSRSDAQKRRILNEEELLPILERHGFERHTLSSLPFAEQAALFRSAEIVVGPHGAGFSHLAFCAPKTPVLEIFSPAYTHLCYWQIASASALPYHYLFGEGERYPESVDPKLDPDIEVDPRKFEQALLHALADR